MEHLYNHLEWKRMADEEDKVKHYCKCGHGVIIPSRIDKEICDWCGNYVFKDKQAEFKYRMKQEMRKGK